MAQLLQLSPLYFLEQLSSFPPSYAFTPLPGESGTYQVRAVHPDLLDRPVQGTFTISRVSINPAAINLSIPFNYEHTVSIQVATGQDTEVNNLRLICNEADQPEGVFPQGIHLTLGDSVPFLASGETETLDFTIWADNTAAETGSLVLKVRSDETGEDAWGTLVINTQFSEALPVLYFTPDHVETGVALDDTVTETIVLENKGLADLEDMSLSLVSPDSTPAPDWVYLNTPVDLGDIPVGETQEVSISFNPTSSVSEDIYTFYLRVTSANYQTTDIGLYVSVTQSGIGNVLFKVSDIYTGTLNEDNELIQGLTGAKIKVQNEEVLTVEETQYTDNLGEALFEDLPAGRYKYRISADNHQEHIGRLWIKPGITINEEVFLDYNLVTVEWEVNETTIEDVYEIVLNVTYETDIPAAVVVVEPPSVTLPEMKAGDVFNGEFTLTNYGLIRADDITVALPEDNQYFRFELSEGLPDSLEAKERITVAYRVTCLQSLNQEEGGSGGIGGGSGGCASVAYDFTCSNGATTSSSTSHCWTHSVAGIPGPEVPDSSIETVIPVPSPSESGSPAPASEPIEGVICFPPPPPCSGPCCGSGGGGDPCKETNQNQCQEVGSSVNTVMREYFHDNKDLSLRVPGGMISVQRSYYRNQWHWGHMSDDLLLQRGRGSGGSLGSIVGIEKDGVTYNRQSQTPPVFVYDTYKITCLGPESAPFGYRWEDKFGNWRAYEALGTSKARMVSYGTPYGVVGKLLYEGVRLIGITDRNDNQVIWYEYNGDGLISAVYDTENRRVDYDYTDGMLTTVRDALGNETTFDYDSKGRITTVIDPGGRELDISYDDYGGVSSVVDSQGNDHFFQYDYDERKKEYYSQIKTPSGKVKEIWYNEDGETKQVDINGRTIQKITKDGRDLIITDEKGNVKRKEYDEWDNLTKVIYPDGSTISYEYEHTFNKRLRKIDEKGVVTEYEYDDNGNMTRKIEAAGTSHERTTEYTYDTGGNQLTIKVLGDATAPESLTTMTYDDNGNMTSIIDPEGNTTQFSHDIMGNVLTKEDAWGKVWTYGYDAMGRLATITDPLGNITRLYYDELGNKTKEVDPEGKEKTYEYDARNNLIKSTDATGNETLFEYNTDDKLIKQTDPQGKELYYEYDNEGRLIKTVDGNGNEISMEYDDTSECPTCSGGGGTGQPTKIIYPTFARGYIYDTRGRKTEEKDILSDTEEHLTGFQYDSSGNLISKTDKESNTTTYDYDELNRLIKVIDPLGQVTEYTYDNRDNLIALRDANGNLTLFDYDSNNRLVRETRPMGEETTYKYDEVGNLVEKIDTKNQKTEYDYDDAGRLVEVRYFNPDDHINPVKTVVFTYDKVSNLKTYTDGITSGEYFYDDSYRKTSETVNYGSFALSYSYTYYKNSTKKSFTAPNGIIYTYTYDNNNQLTSVQIPGKGSITYPSYTWNRPASMALPGGSTKDYQYDSLMRVKEITSKDPGQNILLNYQFNYDKMDNITVKQTEHGSYDYGYDDLYRLTGADNPVQDDEAFTYDPVGNRLTSEGVTGDWSYNANNELTAYDDVSYVYDDNGNMIQKTAEGVVTNFVYNVEDRLIEVRDGSDSLIASYYYDPFGRRLWKDVDGTRTYFLYSDEGLVGEYDESGQEIRSYGYRSGSTWTTDPLFMKVGSEYYFYQNDHLGTPQKMTGINGGVVWEAKYSSFGEAEVKDTSTITNNLRFPGQYFDQETGLHYNYFRYYDPRTGRYLRADPSLSLNPYFYILFLLHQQLETPHEFNPFAYVGNNPANFTDPMGLLKECGPCEERVFNSDKLLSCLGQRAAQILTFGAACAVAIVARVPPIAKIPAIIGACGSTAGLIIDCIFKAYECKRIGGI